MSQRLTYGIEDKPPVLTSLGLGFQQYLTMFGSTVAIPLILADSLGLKDRPEQLAWLIGTMFFVSGITTLIQTTVGNRLPLIQGGTFSFLTPAITICGMASLVDAGFEVRMQHIQGAIILGSLFEIFLGATGLVGRLLRFVGPVTIAPTIALIGLALFKFGAPEAGRHWGIGGLTITLVIVFSQILSRKSKIFALFPILLAILVAWGVAALGTYRGWFPDGHAAHVSVKPIADADWFRIPYPFQWGMPVFGAAAFVAMLAGYMASVVESVGDYYACARMADAPPPTKEKVSRGILAEGVGCFIAGVFGTGNGTTSYSENIGAIGLTKVASRRVIQFGAGIMMVLGLFGKFGACFATMPKPIVGGMYCVMFGMIAAVGLSNLQFVDLNSSRNLFIIGFALFMGLSMPEYISNNPVTISPDWLADILNTLGKTGMAVGAFIALTLDNVLPGSREERGLDAFKSG